MFPNQLQPSYRVVEGKRGGGGEGGGDAGTL